MSSDKTMTPAKDSILNAYFNGCAISNALGATEDVSKTTDEIINELEPMARFTQDEINDFMQASGFVCERRHGIVKWSIFTTPEQDS